MVDKLSQRYNLTKSDMKRVFSSADIDRNGQLDLDEVILIFERILVGVPSSKIKELASLYDLDSDGYLNFDEFFDCLLNRRVPDIRPSISTVAKDELLCQVHSFLKSLRIHLLQLVKNQIKSEKFNRTKKPQDINTRGQELLLRHFPKGVNTLPVDIFCR